MATARKKSEIPMAAAFSTGGAVLLGLAFRDWLMPRLSKSFVGDHNLRAAPTETGGFLIQWQDGIGKHRIDIQADESVSCIAVDADSGGEFGRRNFPPAEVGAQLAALRKWFRRLFAKFSDVKRARSMRVGEVLDGTIKLMQGELGQKTKIYVNVGGLLCDMRRREISWNTDACSAESLKDGQQIKVRVIRIDESRGRVQVSLRQVEKLATPPERPSRSRSAGDGEREIPLEDILATHALGSVCEGIVAELNAKKNGAYIDLGSGVRGFLSAIELSWAGKLRRESFVDFLSRSLKVGQQVKAIVIGGDSRTRCVVLSIKRMHPDSWADVEKRFPVGAVAQGVVTRVLKFGAFVQLAPGVDGLLHSSRLDPDNDNADARKMLITGQDVACVVLQLDMEGRQITLGLRDTVGDRWLERVTKEYWPGILVRGRATKLMNYGVFVELEPGIEALLHKNEMGDDAPPDWQNRFAPGTPVEARITNVDSATRKIGLSIKSHSEATFQ
jgi:small subunit ribosomal protein S1